MPVRHDLRRARTAVFVLLLWVALFEPSWDLLPTIVEADGRLTGVQLPATVSLTVSPAALVNARLLACLDEHGHGRPLIVEITEHAAELDVLRVHGVHAAQGYLLCRPVPVDELPTRYGLAPDPVGSRP